MRANLVPALLSNIFTILLPTLSFILYPSHLFAHPVPRRAHDRTIVVYLTSEKVIVRYRLEVDPYTVVYQDLPAVDDMVDLSTLKKPRDFYEAFTRCYAPILAGNLDATLDDKSLTFRCTRQTYTLQDEEGQALDHLRCDFVFKASWQLDPARRQRFAFKENNYENESGLIQLALTGDSSLELLDRTGPDKALFSRQTRDLKPGEEASLRRVSAVVVVTSTKPETALAPTDVTVPPSEEANQPTGLPTLLLDPDRGLWLLLLLAAGLGGVHALTPGHGKTLVAAYLVGERGTIWHALFLGLITTITHTGAVLVLAALLPVFFPKTAPADVQSVLGMAGGLLIAGLGLWLLLRRLAGQADHIHLGGHAHQHGHEAGRQTHDLDADRPVGWWGLTVLGVSGGIVPCWDAIIMLGFAVSARRLWLALPLLLAFSAGLAAVLVAIGITVVCTKGFSGSRWGESRLFRALPVISAALVTALGLWLCYESTHSR